MSVAPELLDAVAELLQPLLQTLERVVWVQRHLYPPVASRLARELAPGRETISGPLQALEALAWPDDLRFMRDRLVEAARQTLALVEAFVEASQSAEGPIGLYRALRRFSGVQETLYPLAPVFEPVSRWFLEPGRRDDDALVAGLRAAALRDDEAKVGARHAAPLAHLAGSHVVHDGAGRGRGAAARDGRVRGRALCRGSRARAPHRHVGRRHLRALLRSSRGHAVHSPRTRLRGAASRPLRHRRSRAGARTAHLPRARRARLDVPGGRRPVDAPGPALRRSPARLPGDRGPVPHLSAGRESEDPRLAAGPSYGLRITRVAAVPLPLPCHSANSKALLTSASGKLCETTFDKGYLSLVLTRKSRAAGMIQGL